MRHALMRYGVLIATTGPTHEIRSTPTKEGSVVAAAGARSRAAGPSSPAPPSRRRSLFLPIAVITGLGIGADYGLPPSVLADIINAPEG
ncbi:MAG TPA: hypothetical protein VE527_14475, partial [Reyranella sp.]|nr:hypothetical protein [Reyranella sp.]